MARPHGPIRLALLAAAAQPGTVTQLAHRSQVSMRNARYSVTRLVQAGDLVILSPGRPALLALPTADPATHQDGMTALSSALAGWR